MSEQPDTITAVQEAVRELHRRLTETVVKPDPALWERALAGDYVFVGAAGEVNTRQQVLEAFRSAAARFESFQTEAEHWRFYGDTAIVTGRAVGRGRNPGGEFRGANRFTGVYVRQGEEWRLAAWQVTPITQAPE